MLLNELAHTNAKNLEWSETRLISVDGSQGDESPFVIQDPVTPGGLECGLGFLKSLERLCVALSCARDVFIFCNANTPAFRREPQFLQAAHLVARSQPRSISQTSFFIVQMLMNLNASLYGHAVIALKEQSGVNNQTVMFGQMIFLVAYGFGSECCAPWSEKYGRKPTMQLSLLFVIPGSYLVLCR